MQAEDLAVCKASIGVLWHIRTDAAMILSVTGLDSGGNSTHSIAAKTAKIVTGPTTLTVEKDVRVGCGGCGWSLLNGNGENCVRE